MLHVPWLMVFQLVIIATVASYVHLQSAALQRERYIREVNMPEVAEEAALDRTKRQTTGYTDRFYATQCGYEIKAKPEGPSIEVLGVGLQYPDATLKAAKLVHLMVRFMSRSVFLRLANQSAVGLFSVQALPANVFNEFKLNMPLECAANCRVITFSNGSTYDCSGWCTSPEYPYNSPSYPINYLWAYGNMSRAFVVETNVVCQGFNPSGGTENYLIREFGLNIVTRALDDDIMSNLDLAYQDSVAQERYKDLKNVYDYFAKGTLAWFNGVIRNDLGGVACSSNPGVAGSNLCETGYDQRNYIKQKDAKLYKVLNHVYNSDRGYLAAGASTCIW
ncbi:uncharacterized protein LOC127875224 isoform X2 [Dreissena polymorpha]|nr:uncharacterized protein LOC127875224 isoform X2 [Dreissena polymorpha]